MFSIQSIVRSLDLELQKVYHFFCELHAFAPREFLWGNLIGRYLQNCSFTPKLLSIINNLRPFIFFNINVRDFGYHFNLIFEKNSCKLNWNLCHLVANSVIFQVNFKWQQISLKYFLSNSMQTKVQNSESLLLDVFTLSYCSYFINFNVVQVIFFWLNIWCQDSLIRFIFIGFGVAGFCEKKEKWFDTLWINVCISYIIILSW